MNIENAKQEFAENAKQVDLSNPKIKRKYEHSFRVMEAAGKIARSLNLSDEEIEISRLIGLLHDIGKFEYKKENSELKDYFTLEHGELGVKVLQKDNYIREYISEDKYDNIIFKAIKNHDLYKIEEGLSEKELLFAKIIRDADKLDIFFEGAEMFWNTKKEQEEVAEAHITKEVLDQFYNCICIDRKNVVTPVDSLISFITFIFDINFTYNYKIIKQEKYIDRILDKFEFQEEVTKEQMDDVRKFVKEYIEKQI